MADFGVGPFGPRLSFQENMELIWLPDRESSSSSSSSSATSSPQRFVSTMPAWKPGKGLPWAEAAAASRGDTSRRERDRTFPKTFGPGAYGGHVYAQAPLAAARVVEKADRATSAGNKLGVHSTQGVFTNPGLTDRPFVYEVTTVNATRSFTTCFVTARQPLEPSSAPEGPYPASDADGPLGDVVFTCLTTFKRPVPSPSEVQLEPSPWRRYASILANRRPEEWEPSPQADIDAVREAFPIHGHAYFPILDMYKVDMTGFNADRPIPERRQLHLYRLHKPLPPPDGAGSGRGQDANESVSVTTADHILCHAFEADRNGLIMLGNHLGYGYGLGAVASLTYAFYVHVNADEAVMRGDGWWMQEVYWPRVSAGRGVMESRIWSPEGVHVASGYQDGIVLPKGRNRGKI